MHKVRSADWMEGFRARLDNEKPWDSYHLYKMAYDVEERMCIPEFNGLQCPKYLPDLKPYPHQLSAAETVIEQMNGKAILSDEVGLGKTIQAGLVLKEYMIRGLVKKALILVPASLINQWIEELHLKFYIPALPYRENYDLAYCDVVVMSIDMAKRSPHKERIYEQKYDMVIVDEAHKLKNPKTKNYQFVQQLNKKFCLLLTATPIQNHIFELFNLISLLKPGHLGNLEAFQAAFSPSKHDVEEDEFLKELIQQVMIRNVRHETDVEWTNRRVQIVPVDFTDEEKEVYDLIAMLPEKSPVFHETFPMITLQREMCSSPGAVLQTLCEMQKKCTGPQEIAFTASLIQKLQRLSSHAKAERTLDILTRINEKVIIFTEYRATQAFLLNLLYEKGITAVPFQGKFSKSKREWMKQLFKDQAQVLIATESGSEGINLQFCHHVINYDLPWNPMKVEQRIGRVHRLGQEHDVHIYNLAVTGTIEDHILDLLQKKIGVFETVIGKLDHILSDYKMSI